MGRPTSPKHQPRMRVRPGITLTAEAVEMIDELAQKRGQTRSGAIEQIIRHTHNIETERTTKTAK